MAVAPHGSWQPATIDLNIMACESLKDVSYIGKMSPYVAAWIDPAAKQCTRMLSKVGRNPVWNDNISLPVHDAILYNPNSYLVLQVHSQDLFSDSIVGTAYFPLFEVLQMRQTGYGQGNIVTLKLQRPSGKMKGIIRFSVQLVGGSLPGNTDDALWAEKEAGAAPTPGAALAQASVPAEGIPVGYAMPPYYPPMAYPPAYGASSSSAQAPTYAFPPGSFGEPKPYYATQQVPYAYQYPAPVPPPRRSSNNGFWAVTTGILGGLLLGDILF